MSEKKKDLSAFLKKNQKKGKTAATTTVDEKTVKEVEKATQENATKSTTQKKDESSDEEVDDELDLETQAMSYGNIKEKKDIATNEKQTASEKQGYGFDTSANPIMRNKGGAEVKEKKDASEITFGGSRPKFGRKVNKGQFGAEFSEGLDDIDDDGNIKNKPKKEFSRAEGGQGGQREFVNLGSKARVGGRPEEEKEPAPLSKATGIKPTFRGKLNLTKTGAGAEEEGDFGVKVNYDFAVSYKTAFVPGELGKERKPREKGVPFGEHMAKKAEDNDDEFEVVKEKERKPRKFNHNDSDDEQPSANADGTKITRGDARATRGGRGGFFKNSAKPEEK